MGLDPFGQGGMWIPPPKDSLDLSEHPSHLCVLFVYSLGNKRCGDGGDRLVFQLGTKWFVPCRPREMKYVCRRRRPEASIEGKSLACSIHSYSRFWIFSNTFLEEVCFPLEVYDFYLFKWVGGFLVSAGQPGVTHSDNIDCLNPIHKYIGIEK